MLANTSRDYLEKNFIQRELFSLQLGVNSIYVLANILSKENKIIIIPTKRSAYFLYAS